MSRPPRFFRFWHMTGGARSLARRVGEAEGTNISCREGRAGQGIHSHHTSAISLALPLVRVNPSSLLAMSGAAPISTATDNENVEMVNLTGDSPVAQTNAEADDDDDDDDDEEDEEYEIEDILGHELKNVSWP